jgi:hypothetical protein
VLGPVKGSCVYGNELASKIKQFFLLNPFQSRDAIWHHTFNSVLHMLQFLGQPKKMLAFFGMESVNPFQPPKIVAYEGHN